MREKQTCVYSNTDKHLSAQNIVYCLTQKNVRKHNYNTYKQIKMSLINKKLNLKNDLTAEIIIKMGLLSI